MNDFLETPPHAVIVRPEAERDARDYVRGFSSKIAPKTLVSDGDWTPWLPAKVGQKFAFDTNECTQLSGINVVETQLNRLRAVGAFSPEALNWFRANGYFDAEGSFALSERFAGITSNTTIDGNSPWAFWQAAAKYGFLPRQDLTYSFDESNKFANQALMCKDYYRKSAVTQAMLDKAVQSLQWIKIQHEWLGGEWNRHTPSRDILEGLTQAPVHIGIPVCIGAYNRTAVPFCSLYEADHCIMLYRQNPDASWRTRDHYNPFDKDFSKDYYIPQAILGVVEAVTSPVLPAPPLSILEGDHLPNPQELDYFGKMMAWLGARISELFNRK